MDARLVGGGAEGHVLPQGHNNVELSLGCRVQDMSTITKCMSIIARNVILCHLLMGCRLVAQN
jgi:hypothetical protein